MRSRTVTVTRELGVWDGNGVTRGVGMERGTAPQVRFLVPPEICLLTLTAP